MSRLVILAMGCFLLGCSTRGVETDRGDESTRLSLDYFDNQQRCISSWRSLIAEWRDQGGRVYSTIAETRRMLEAESTSKLGNIFRASWLRQVEEPHADPGEIFASVAERYVPEDCAAFSWLGELLAGEEGVMSESDMAELYSQTTEVDEDQAPLLGVWVVTQLLPARKR